MRYLQFVTCLSLALLVSCGAQKVAVKYADSYIERQVEKRLPLTEGQEEVLSKDIDKFLNDHKEEVRKIIPLLSNINLENPASLEEQYPKFISAYLDIARDFSRVLSKHMSSFDKKQIKEFLKMMREENNEIFLKDKKERKAKIEDRVESLLGSITKDQKKILKENAPYFDKQIVDRSERRARLHTSFKQILEQDISTEAKEKSLYDVFVAYQKEAVSNSKNLEIAKAFIPTLKPEQKKNLKTRLAELDQLLNYFIETVY